MMEEAALLDDTSESKIPDKSAKMISKLKDLFPLHWCVWHNNIEELDRILANKDQVSTTPASRPILTRKIHVIICLHDISEVIARTQTLLALTIFQRKIKVSTIIQLS